MWYNDSRVKIAASMGGKPTIGEVAKKGGEVWKTTSDAEKTPWEEKAKKLKDDYENYLKSPEGEAAMKAYKDATKGAKDEVAEPSAKRATKDDKDEAAEPSPKKAKKSELSGTAAHQLSEAILEKCTKMGMADKSGVSYKKLLQKLMANPGVPEIGEEKALEALKKHGGLLNKARSEICGGA